MYLCKLFASVVSRQHNQTYLLTATVHLLSSRQLTCKAVEGRGRKRERGRREREEGERKRERGERREERGGERRKREKGIGKEGTKKIIYSY